MYHAFNGKEGNERKATKKLMTAPFILNHHMRSRQYRRYFILNETHYMQITFAETKSGKRRCENAILTFQSLARATQIPFFRIKNYSRIFEYIFLPFFPSPPPPPPAVSFLYALLSYISFFFHFDLLRAAKEEKRTSF